MRNYLIIANRDSRDFGVYISGQGTFSAPEKAYTFYDVPGRSGAVIGNDRRLENIEVSYECFIYSDFNKNIADFRTFLLSLDGYQRLEDSYHTDEYRMAVYAGPFEPEVTAKNDAGAFTLTFNCKPQRYLKSGEAKYSWVPGGQYSIQGNPINVFAPKIDKTWISTSVGVSYQENDWFESSSKYVFSGFSRVNLLVNRKIVFAADLGQDDCSGATVNFAAGTYSIYAIITKLSTLSWVVVDSSRGIYQTSAATDYNRIIESNTYPIRNVSTATNITEAQSILDGFDRGIACFNGTIIFKESLLANKTFEEFEAWLESVNYGGFDYGAVYVNGSLIYTSYIYGTFTPYVMGDYQGFIDIAVRPGTYVTTPDRTVDGNVQVYYMAESSMSNPTMFPSAPLVRVYGTGSFEMDNVTVTISTCDSFTDIDCELMDCYEGNVNRNSAVSFSTYDFPNLQPGYNEVTLGAGITAVQITPRWWRV